MTDEIIWGAANIARAIGRSEKAVFHALQQGQIPGARKVAGRWGLNPRVFFATFDYDPCGYKEPDESEQLKIQYAEKAIEIARANGTKTHPRVQAIKDRRDF
jgi:hypothetical protein